MLSILIIDDTPEKISTLRDLIKESGINTEPIIAHDFREAMAKMGETLFDLVILDLNIPKNWGEDSNVNHQYSVRWGK